MEISGKCMYISQACNLPRDISKTVLFYAENNGEKVTPSVKVSYVWLVLFLGRRWVDNEIPNWRISPPPSLKFYQL